MSCSSCFKGFLSFIIILNMFIGLAIVGSALWLYLDGGVLWTYLYGFNIGPVISGIDYFHYVLYALFILGSIKVFMSFIGCCTVSRVTFVLVFLLFGVQIAAGVCAWYFKDDFTLLVGTALVSFVDNGYEAMNTTTDLAFDRLQSGLGCCGSMSPDDWRNSLYNEGGIESSVPPSCCKDVDFDTCERDRVITSDDFSNIAIYPVGCTKMILNPIYFYIYRYEALGILAAYVLIEFLAMTIKLFAFRKRYDDYEDSHMMELKPYR